MAAIKSGEFSSPMEKEWRRGHSFLGSRCEKREAMEATSDESSPPERRTPQGTSDIMRRFTDW